MRTEVKTLVSVLVLEVELKLSSISGVTRGHHALKQYGAETIRHRGPDYEL